MARALRPRRPLLAVLGNLGVDVVAVGLPVLPGHPPDNGETMRERDDGCRRIRRLHPCCTAQCGLQSAFAIERAGHLVFWEGLDRW